MHDRSRARGQGHAPARGLHVEPAGERRDERCPLLPSHDGPAVTAHLGLVRHQLQHLVRGADLHAAFLQHRGEQVLVGKADGGGRAHRHRHPGQVEPREGIGGRADALTEAHGRPLPRLAPVTSGGGELDLALDEADAGQRGGGRGQGGSGPGGGCGEDQRGEREVK